MTWVATKGKSKKRKREISDESFIALPRHWSDWLGVSSGVGGPGKSGGRQAMRSQQIGGTSVLWETKGGGNGGRKDKIAMHEVSDKKPAQKLDFCCLNAHTTSRESCVCHEEGQHGPRGSASARRLGA